MSTSLKQEKKERLFHFYEVVLILSGVFMLLSVGFIYLADQFFIWTLAKIFYGVGVLLFVWKA